MRAQGSIAVNLSCYAGSEIYSKAYESILKINAGTMETGERYVRKKRRSETDCEQ